MLVEELIKELQKFIDYKVVCIEGGEDVYKKLGDIAIIDRENKKIYL